MNKISNPIKSLVNPYTSTSSKRATKSRSREVRA